MVEEQVLDEQNINEPAAKSGGLGKIAAWIFVVGLLVIVGVQLGKAQQGTVGPGEPAPLFTFTTFQGEEFSTVDLNGKVIVVNFWASWCVPCQQEAAELQTAWEMYAPSGEVVFFGVDYIDTDKEAAAYIEKFQITYPNGPDLGTRISQAFRIRGVPETYIIDKQGNIAFIKIGPFISLQEITTAIDAVLIK